MHKLKAEQQHQHISMQAASHNQSMNAIGWIGRPEFLLGRLHEMSVEGARYSQPDCHPWLEILGHLLNCLPMTLRDPSQNSFQRLLCYRGPLRVCCHDVLDRIEAWNQPRSQADRR